MAFDEDEIERGNRTQAALLLHITPQEVDEMPYLDVMDVLQVARANDAIREYHDAKKYEARMKAMYPRKGKR